MLVWFICPVTRLIGTYEHIPDNRARWPPVLGFVEVCAKDLEVLAPLLSRYDVISFLVRCRIELADARRRKTGQYRDTECHHLSQILLVAVSAARPQMDLNRRSLHRNLG